MPSPIHLFLYHFSTSSSSTTTHQTQLTHSLNTPTQAEEILNKQSGWKALTGTTDFGKIASNAFSSSSSNNGQDDDDDFSNQSRLAFSIMVDRITGYVGSYFVSLEGRVDALVFAGGIGEKSALLRAKVVEKIKCLGFEIDARRNDHVEEEKRADDQVVVDVGSETARFRTLVCWTDEQYEMARGCVCDDRFWGEE